MRKILFSFAVMSVLIPEMAGAHHSFAMFDNAREVTIAGEVSRYEWTNPHTWIYVAVRDEKNKISEWSIETAGPSLLRRAGWSQSTLKAGDKVTVVLNPLKNGDNGGSLVSIRLPDGRTLGTRK